MDRQVSEKEKRDRSNIMRECLAQKRGQFIDKQLNKIIHTIIIEQERPARGITSNYIRVEIPEADCKKNSWQKVMLKEYLPDKNRCEAVACEE